MIYKQNQKRKSFDESIIRSVDAVVNSTFHANHDEHLVHLSLPQFSSEFRTVFLKLPRQCGKTTYLSRLKTHLETEYGLLVYVVVPRLQMKKPYENENHVYILSTLHSEDFFRGYQKYPDVILYDEVSESTKGVRVIPGSLYTLGLYT